MTTDLSLSKVFNPRPGWYRGDFHAHTNFSDGYYSAPELAGLARTEGLDFFAITDHNTIEAYPHFGDEPGVLIIPGMEVTMQEGHYNIFGLEGQFDWLPDVCVWPAGVAHPTGQYPTPTRLMKQIAAHGLLNSINHPFLVPWDWLDFETELSSIHCLEIFNDPVFIENDVANPQAVAMWTRWLNAGYRITAIGGADYHQPQLNPGYKAPQRLGFPSTYVYADELSGAAILAGVRRRRVYVSLGPQLTFQASCNGSSHPIGADMGDVTGQVEFSGTVTHNQPVQARLIKNGQAIASQSFQTGSGNWQFADEIAAAQPVWYRLDLLDEEEQIVAVTNPVFAGPQLQPAPPTYGDFLTDKSGRDRLAQ